MVTVDKKMGLNKEPIGAQVRVQLSHENRVVTMVTNFSSSRSRVD
jgi:hypothetical protein